MSFGYDPEPLQHSLRSVGILNPPIVREERNAKATIIVGFRRIQAARRLGWKSVPCKIVSHSELGDLPGLLINLHDNLTVRALNEVEKGMVLSRLENHFGTEEIVNRFMPLLELASHLPLCRFYLDAEKALSVEEKEYVAQGSVSLNALKAAMTLEPPARLSLLRLLHILRFNINQQLQFIDYIIDLSHITHKDIQEMVQGPPFLELCGQPHENRPQKARAILNHLRAERFPTLSHAEQRFRSAVSRLNLPNGVRIEPPPYFEGPDLKMEIRFKDGGDLRRKVDDLARLEALGTIGPPQEAFRDD